MAGSSARAEISTTPVSSGFTVAQLAETLAGAGVTISNGSSSNSDGWPASRGSFTGGASTVGFDSGVILSSGYIANIVGPNNSDDKGMFLSTGIGTDLDPLASGHWLGDGAMIEFDFVPTTPAVRLTYVFASEEYDEFVNTPVADVFALFVNGVNYALLPDGATVVSINNVNHGNPDGENGGAGYPTNPDFHVANDCSSGGCPLDIQADGLTVVLEMRAPVTPNVVNHLKLSVADVEDYWQDSWLMVKAGSLTAIEECTNQIDDDLDELVDNDDPDCHVCGDGNLDPGEECDDGNVAGTIGAGDGCMPLCQLDCGNGAVDPGEACDGIEGCAAACVSEQGWQCGNDEELGQWCDSICGDGVLVGDEQCDDENTTSGDGCSSTCQTEATPTPTPWPTPFPTPWPTPPPTPWPTPTSASAVCGDGVVDEDVLPPCPELSGRCTIKPKARGARVIAEQCDDANTTSGDGCDESCQVESGYSCRGAPSECFLSFEIDRVVFWPALGDFATIVARGNLGSGQVLDADGGVTIRAWESGGQTVEATFTDAECRADQRGGFLCADETTPERLVNRLRIVPARGTGGYRLKLFFSAAVLAAGLDGPAGMDVIPATGSAYRGTATDCRGGTPPAYRLFCRAP